MGQSMTSVPTEKNQTVFQYLQTLATAGFWGSMTLKFEAGCVVHIRKEENFKPDELSGHPGLGDAKEGRS